ncbi:hypothetical protein C8Q74DRAFT_1258718 [Fomes fomentarius]|nr:hypothetical protein C8Q74DRAFT_1258718 [Fomes fomentarius]
MDDHLLARHGKKNGTIDVDYYVKHKCERRKTRVYSSDLSHCKQEMAEVEAGKAFFATF